MRRPLTFQSKLMILFVSMALVPTVSLVLVSYQLISESVERWASHEIAATLANSVEVAGEARKLAQTLELYENVSLTEDAEVLAVDYDLVEALHASDAEALRERATQLADAYGGYLIAIYDRNGHLAFSTDADLPPKDLTAFLPPLAELPDGPTVSRELSDRGLQIVGVPVFSEDGESRLGAVVLGKFMEMTPAQVQEQIDTIKAKLDGLATELDIEKTDYRRTEKRTTAFALLIAGALITAVAFWVSKLLAKGIQTPLQALVAGTTQIAEGNLDYKVQTFTDDEFSVLAKAFNQMVAELKAQTEALRRAEKIAAWQDIAQKLAHEIKNPLTPIQLSAQRLQRRYRQNRDGFDELLERCTQTIIEEVEGLRRLLDEFSLLAKMPAPRLSDVDVRDTVEAALAVFGEFPAHIECQIDVPPGLPPAHADSEHLKRALVNLIKNSLEAMAEQPSGKLTVRAFRDSDLVFIQVFDTGPGISDEIRPKLFTPHLSTKREGTGLGLAIVKKVMTDLGGDIYLEQSGQAGTTFTLWLNASIVKR